MDVARYIAAEAPSVHRLMLKTYLPAILARHRADVLREAAQVADDLTSYAVAELLRLADEAVDGPGQPGKNESDHAGLVGRATRQSPSSPDEAIAE